MLLSGCREAAPWQATEAGNRGAAVAAVALAEAIEHAPAKPDPQPRPTPSGDCDRCGGDGLIDTDGRVPPITCPVCGGDGKADPLPNFWRQQVADTIGQSRQEVRDELDARIAAIEAAAAEREAAAAEPDDAGVWLDDWNEAEQLARETGKPILAHIGGPSCEPCVAMRPWLERDDVARRLDWCVPVMLDGEASYNADKTVAEAFKVKHVPADVVVRLEDGRRKVAGGRVPPTPTSGATVADYLKHLETMEEKYR